MNFLEVMTMLKEVKIELTNRCFRNCKHCSSSATNNSNNVKELDFEDVKKIIYEAKDMNVETIVFTGGEPLMYERLPELIKATSKSGMNSTLYTFAYRNEKNLNKYRELLHNGLNKDKSGMFLPFSQFPTVRSDTPNFSANSCCVIFFFFLHSAINLPIFS